MIVLLTKLLSIVFMVKSSPAPMLNGVNGNAPHLETALHASNGDTAGVRVGFLGCGTIASAIATGLATQTNMAIESIAVTKRSESKSSALLEGFSSLVSIHEDNQEILDKSDIVFVCLLPQQTSNALQALSFDDSRHELISLVSTAKLEELALDSKLPTTKVSKLLCLPAISRHQGVALHCSPTPNALKRQLLESMGGLVECQTEDQLSVCMISTAVMGTHYGTLRQNREWFMERGGMSKLEASNLVIRQYEAILQDAVARGGDNADILDELIEEQTPGGLNEQALGNLDKLGGLNAYDQVMDAMLARIKGASDGSL